MKTWFILVIAAFAIGWASNACAATDDEYEIKSQQAEKHAQKIIEECEAPSREDWDSGVTSRMREGSYKEIECLTTNIKELAQKIIKKDEVKNFSEHLDKYIENAYYIYFINHNANKSCTPCGTMYQVMYLGDVTGAVKDILKTMLLTAYWEDILK